MFLLWKTSFHFDNLGQRLRVGKALTPPEGLFATAQPVVNSMPTATALAVATITAQLQAKEAETKPTTVCAFNIREKISLNFSLRLLHRSWIIH